MKRPWKPDWTVAPAELLQEWLDEHDVHEISEDEQLVIDWVIERKPMSMHDCQVLSETTGISMMFWSEMERRYRADIAKGKVETRG